VDQLRVATFNVRNAKAWKDGANHWFFRREALAQLIEVMAPDVVGLQEVYAVQLRWILERLPGYRHVGVGRVDGISKGEFVPILYNPERLHLEGSRTRWLSDTPDVPGSKDWGNHFPRIVTMAWFTDKASGRRFGVANLHADEKDEAIRAKSGEAISRWLQEDGPWSVVGDWNTVPGRPAIQRMLDAGWVDVLAHLPGDGPEARTNHDYTEQRDGTRIDHIFLGPAWTVREASIVREKPGGRYPSDHWPVLAVLDWKDATGE
jgi:endonuclease/exonuclease/phosphatase family metal-dependent hydrolase